MPRHERSSCNQGHWKIDDPSFVQAFAAIRCGPECNHSAIIGSSTFIPFLCACGLQFEHQVGRMILVDLDLNLEYHWRKADSGAAAGHHSLLVFLLCTSTLVSDIAISLP
ncbi:hypothetical protein BD779DRAFT_1562581 [Infundibulicybe gibba]|nr:hypothetical protein BD779DRAFT_1562581 [Infundibulicybe gibba]